MATIRLDVTLNGSTRTINVDIDEIPMGFFEDVSKLDPKDMGGILKEYGGMLGFTHEEMRQMRRGDFMRVLNAMKSITEGDVSAVVPPGNGPGSA